MMMVAIMMLKGITIMTMVQMIGLLLRWRWYAPADDNYNYVSDGYDDYIYDVHVDNYTDVKGDKTDNISNY